MEATLAIPALSNEQQRDKGGEEERIMMRVNEQDPSVSHSADGGIQESNLCVYPGTLGK